MLALVLGAVRTRTAQVLTVLILTAIAAAAAAAGPWYGLAAASRAAAADVEAAPAGQRVLSIRQLVTTDGDPQGSLTAFARTVSGILPIPAGDPVLGMSQDMTVTRGAASKDVSIDYREEFCTHVRLDGKCPATAGEVAISQTSAQELGVDAGDRIVIRASPTTTPVPLRVVARYELADPTGAYWSNNLFRAKGGLDPLFTPLDTFTDRQLWTPTNAFDVVVPAAVLRDRGAGLAVALRAADARYEAQQLRLVNPTATILATIAKDRSTIQHGVLVALGQVLVLAWFAIGLAGRYTGRDRRGDAALLKLRGSTRPGMLRLTLGQHLVPMLAGIVAGAPLGYLAAWALGGEIPAPPQTGLALGLSAAAVGAVLVGGLLVLAAVDAAVLRLPVVALLRRVPAGRRDWRAGVVDLALLAVAVAAAYQARASGPDTGLGLVAPALVALAVGLLAARLLILIADRAGAVALRAGRLRFGLTAVQVSRQPGSDRVFALIVVAVALFATAAGGFSAGRIARTDRAEAELGADRVLTVQATNRVALQSAVRRADPGGRYAMAAVVDLASTPPLLAVDTTRLAAVATWRPEYGPVGVLPAATAAARPRAALPPITGTQLTLRVRNERAERLTLGAVVQNGATGVTAKVALGPFGRGEQTVSAPVAGCAAAPGCRFVRWELTGPPDRGGETQPPPADAVVTIESLTQQGPDAGILDTARLTDLSRWHSDLAGAGMDLAAASRSGAGLTISVDANPLGFPTVGNEVYAVDAPLPLPVLVAGAAPAPWQFGDPSLLSFGAGATPVRLAGTAAVLPVIGAQGMMIDLDATWRIAADATLGGTFQVWLGADAPPSIVDALTREGLGVVADDSVRARSDRLAEQGTAIGVRFGLLAAVLGLLLAAATVAVTAAVDRGQQITQLTALRVQGLPRRAAVVSGYAGLTALIGSGLLGGLVAAAIAGPVSRVAAPAFTDRWTVLAPPDPLTVLVLVLAGLVALVVLGLTGWLSVLPLIRRLRGGDR
jgi:putative ABC transport system permease protein